MTADISYTARLAKLRARYQDIKTEWEKLRTVLEGRARNVALAAIDSWNADPAHPRARCSSITLSPHDLHSLLHSVSFSPGGGRRIPPRPSAIVRVEGVAPPEALVDLGRRMQALAASDGIDFTCLPPYPPDDGHGQVGPGL